MRLQLRYAREADIEAVWSINSQPEVRAMSLNSQDIPWEVHTNWFSRVTSEAKLWVAEVEGSVIGVIRFDRLNHNTAEISIALHKDWQSRGLGRRLIRESSLRFKHQSGAEQILARIKPANFRSRAAFLAAGYEHRHSTDLEHFYFSAQPSTLAVITARGGSKRLPRKNLRPFLGKPILQYPIAAALQSGLFNEVMVSTDDDEIADLSLKSGAQVPFRRSPHTSDDHAGTASVLLEVLSAYAERGQRFDECCCLYPTAPFVTAARLVQAAKQMRSTGAPCVFPVQAVTSRVWRSLRRDAQGRVSYVFPEFSQSRSQDLETVYLDCGQFYFFQVENFRAGGQLVTPEAIGIEVGELESQDIDNESDWILAELKYQAQQNPTTQSIT